MSDAAEKVDTNLLQILVATQSLHASHDIMSELERSKCYVEQTIDHLSTAYAVVNERGDILKANRSIARWFGTDVEDLAGRNMSEIFRKESWSIFVEKKRHLKPDAGRDQAVEFELSIETGDKVCVEYLWTIRPMGDLKGDFEALYQVIGQDISEVKRFEKQLSQIFSCIPLGIFTIDRAACVVGPYSSYVEHLLELNEIAGRSLNAILFDRCGDHVTAKMRDGIAQIKASLGVDAFWFDSSKVFFPSEVRIPCSNNDDLGYRWIGLSYHPVVQEGIVDRILLVLDDRTSVVMARAERNKLKDQENRSLQRIVEIQRCNQVLLDATIAELDDYRHRLEHYLSQMAPIQSFCKTLHGIKGLARTAEFSYLKEMVHDTEDRLKALPGDENAAGKEGILSEIAPVTGELKELVELYRAVTGKGSSNAPELKQRVRTYAEFIASDVLATLGRCAASADERLQTTIAEVARQLVRLCPTKTPLRDYEPVLRSRVEQTARTVGKSVDLHFDWKDVSIDSDDLSVFGEIALHILNNALDHGIDSEDVRVAAGKPTKGQLHVWASANADGSLTFGFQDDGRGIDPDKVAQCAIERGLIDAERARQMSASDKQRLILAPGFSTAGAVTEVSGRGVGLDAVVGAVESLNGTGPTISSERGKGTKFEVTIYLGGRRTR